MSALPATTLGAAERGDQAIVLRPDRKSAAVVREAFRHIYGKANVARARLAEWHGTLKATDPESVECDETGKIVGYSYSAKLPWGPTVAEYFGPRRRMPAMPREVAHSKTKHVERHQAATIIARTLLDEIVPKRPGVSPFNAKNLADLAARHGTLAAAHGIKLTPCVLARIVEVVLTGKGHIDGRVNSGRRREQWDQRVMNWIRDAYLHEKCSLRRAWKEGVRLAEELGVRAPQLSAARLWIKRTLTPSAIDCARLSTKRWAAKHEPHLTRDDSSMLPMDEWQIDGTTLNIWCRAYGVNGVYTFRPALIAVIDARSRRIMGYTLSASEDWAATLRCLRSAILRFGKPRAIYVDNGAGFAKALRSHFLKRQGTFLTRLGIESKNSIPGRPQGRGRIERLFGTFHTDFERLHPDYSGNNPSERPEGVERRRRKFPESFATIADVSADIEAWIHRYEGEPHSAKGMGNLSPRAAWDALIGDAEVTTPTPSEISWAASVVLKRKVARRGVFHNDIAYGGHQSEVLRLTGRTVWIRVDADDATSVGICSDADGTPMIDPDSQLPIVATNDEMRGRTQDEIGELMRLKSHMRRRAKNEARASSVVYLPTAEAVHEVARSRRGVAGSVSSSAGTPSQRQPADVVSLPEAGGAIAAAMRQVQENAKPVARLARTGTDDAAQQLADELMDGGESPRSFKTVAEIIAEELAGDSQ